MQANLFHVFRNTPLGRETLMQSIYFCRLLDVGLTLYIPDSVRFMMYFDHDAVQVDLDQSISRLRKRRPIGPLALPPMPV